MDLKIQILFKLFKPTSILTSFVFTTFAITFTDSQIDNLNEKDFGIENQPITSTNNYDVSITECYLLVYLLVHFQSFNLPNCMPTEQQLFHFFHLFMLCTQFSDIDRKRKLITWLSSRFSGAP